MPRIWTVLACAAIAIRSALESDVLDMALAVLLLITDLELRAELDRKADR